MNLPNWITISRFAMIPLFLGLYFNHHPIAALGVVLLSGLTDMLDGHLARRSGQITTAGIMLDPLADKLMMLAVVAALLAEGEIPWQAAAAMAVREVGMIAGSALLHFKGRKTISANAVGKLTTVVYYAAIVLLLLDWPGGVFLLWCGVGLSFVASGVYFLKFRGLNRA